jgi:hypothetical protein
LTVWLNTNFPKKNMVFVKKLAIKRIDINTEKYSVYTGCLKKMYTLFKGAKD